MKLFWIAVSDLVKLIADLSRIPEHEIEQHKGADVQCTIYYLDCAFEMKNYSASTKFELVYKNVKYASVKAEYV